jgi:dihydropteroate synthase type 1
LSASPCPDCHPLIPLFGTLRSAPPVAVMGIVNLTSDSFYAPSRVGNADEAVGTVRRLLADGTDIVDLGAAASHPDAIVVSAQEEIDRLEPVLDGLRELVQHVSIDSFQPAVQRFALQHGVGYLNDIQGFGDEAMYPALAESACNLVVMHSTQQQGGADRRGSLTASSALDAILQYFDARLRELEDAGIARERMILDPGMGFFLSPLPEASLSVLANLDRLKAAFGLRVLVSVSRKSFLRATTGLPPEALGPASLVAELHAISCGVDVIRTHSPGELRSALRLMEALTRHATP